ncbi:hypothetical protein C0J52_19477 [Blattella germanica]|nr:hypothetical protein C0J52_19477 [Blattella germanica]
MKRCGLVLFIRVFYGMNGEFFIGLYENLGSSISEDKKSKYPPSVLLNMRGDLGLQLSLCTPASTAGVHSAEIHINILPLFLNCRIYSHNSHPRNPAKRQSRKWFDDECVDMVHKRKLAKMNWMREPNEQYSEQLCSIRRETTRFLKNKKREYLKEKINDLEINARNRNIRELYLGIRIERKGFQARTNIITNENGDMLADAKSILNRWANYLNQLLNVHGEEDIKENNLQTAEVLVEEPSEIEVEMAIEKLKMYKASVSTNKQGTKWDPTIRYEKNAEEVHQEKKEIYDPTIAYFKTKYDLDSFGGDQSSHRCQRCYSKIVQYLPETI